MKEGLKILGKDWKFLLSLLGLPLAIAGLAYLCRTIDKMIENMGPEVLEKLMWGVLIGVPAVVVLSYFLNSAVGPTKK